MPGFDVSPGLFAPGTQLDYVESSSVLTVTATTAATAQAHITGSAINYDGNTRIKVEYFAPFAGNTQFISIDLWDGSTDLGVVSQSNGTNVFAYGAIFLTPSAGSHTFSFRAWRGTGSADIDPGVGGAATRIPAWYRITVA